MDWPTLIIEKLPFNNHLLGKPNKQAVKERNWEEESHNENLVAKLMIFRCPRYYYPLKPTLGQNFID